MATARIDFWIWIWSTRHWAGAGSGLFISLLEKLNLFHLSVLRLLVLLMWKWTGLFLWKNHLLKCWDWLSLLHWIGALTLSLLLKVSPKKLEACFWAGAANCYLELLNKLQKWICRTVGPSLAASLEPLVHRQNEASLSLFYRY